MGAKVACEPSLWGFGDGSPEAIKPRRQTGPTGTVLIVLAADGIRERPVLFRLKVPGAPAWGRRSTKPTIPPHERHGAWHVVGKHWLPSARAQPPGGVSVGAGLDLLSWSWRELVPGQAGAGQSPLLHQKKPSTDVFFQHS